MPDLRGQLARQLKWAMYKHGDSLIREEVWLNNLADECIRQMEWASRQERIITESIDCSEYPGMHGVRVLGLKPLTAAPEDWKP